MDASYSSLLAIVAPLILLAVLWRRWAHLSKTTGEPPMVPYRIPWLGHAISFGSDMNGFAEWVRPFFPTQTAITLQIAGRHLYLIFDAKLASQVYRRSQSFDFDPIHLLVWDFVDAPKSDVQIAKMGTQDGKKDSSIHDDGRRVLHDFNALSAANLRGEPLDMLTRKFMEVLCEEIDRMFPEKSFNGRDEDEGGSEGEDGWKTVDLGKVVKHIWTRASITALCGSYIYSVWPDVDTWMWDWDTGIPTIMTKMPRLLFPKPYQVRAQGLKMSEKWEAEVRRAETEGKVDLRDGKSWNPYWGHPFNRERMELLRKAGISERGRAGHTISLLWGLTGNTIPVATQVLNQVALNRNLLENLRQEIAQCQTGPVSFDMSKVTTRPRLKSVFLEALRWGSASPSPRVVQEDCDLGGFRLKANSLLMVNARILQMDENTWEISNNPLSDPSRFWAERFLDADEDGDQQDGGDNTADIHERSSSSSQFITKHGSKRPIVEPISISGPKSKETQQRLQSLRPFGGGTSLCPGRHFATNEILGGLAAMMLRLDMEVVEEELERNGMPLPNVKRQGGLFPDRALMVRMRRRRR